MPCVAPNKAVLLSPRNCWNKASNRHHPEMNANCMNVSVTGYLKVIRIALAELFDNALDMYHSRHSRTN